MKQADRTKVCTSCEADVNSEATYCPFCGADLLPLSAKADPLPQDDKFTSQSFQESLASLYKPPYSVRNTKGLGVPEESEESGYTEVKEPEEDPLFRPYEETVLKEAPAPRKSINRRGTVLPLLLLALGVTLLFLGLFLLLFSSDGVVTLQWKSRYWFIYALTSLPALFLGAKLLKSIPEDLEAPSES